MVVVSETRADASEEADPPSAVRERAEAFAAEVVAEAMGHPVQLGNGGLYVRGLLEQGERKSLEPMVARLAGRLTISRCSSSWLLVRGIRWR